MAIDAGADLIGLVGQMPTSPVPIYVDKAAAIARGLPPSIGATLLSSAVDLDPLEAELPLLRPAVLQLVDAVEPAVLEALRCRVGGTRLLQVLHVQDATVLE